MNAEAGAMSDAEADAVGKLLQAYKRILAKDLARASDGGRMFVVITAPKGRQGSAHFVTNMKGIEDAIPFHELLGAVSRLYGDPILLHTGHMDHE